MKDIRIPQTKKVVEGFLTKTELNDAKIMIRYNNTVVVIVKDTVLYTVNLKDLPEAPPIAFLYTNIINEDECIVDIQLLSYIENIYTNYLFNMKSPTIRVMNARTDEAFESLLGMKAADGMKFYKIYDLHKVYHIPIFSGFPNLNKADIIDIEVYDNEGLYIIIKMNIFKKKINRYISMIYRTIKLTT